MRVGGVATREFSAPWNLCLRSGPDCPVVQIAEARRRRFFTFSAASPFSQMDAGETTAVVRQRDIRSLIASLAMLQYGRFSGFTLVRTLGNMPMVPSENLRSKIWSDQASTRYRHDPHSNR